MIKQTKRIIIFTFGVIFLLLGVVGLALPFLQGILFLVVGILLLSVLSPAVRVWLDRRTVRYPTLHTAAGKIDKWVRKIVGEV